MMEHDPLRSKNLYDKPEYAGPKGAGIGDYIEPWKDDFIDQTLQRLDEEEKAKGR